MPWTRMMIAMLGWLLGLMLHRQGLHLRSQCTGNRMGPTSTVAMGVMKQTPSLPLALTHRPSSESLVDELLSLEKRQRREETSEMGLQAVADLGRRVLRGPFLQKWQEAGAEKPRWAWDPAAADEALDPTHEDLDDLVLGAGALRAIQRALALAWRLQYRCKRTTPLSANGNWVGDKALSRGTSMVPLGETRSIRLDTAYDWHHGSDGSNRSALLWKSATSRPRWMCWRDRSLRAQDVRADATAPQHHSTAGCQGVP
ncbi:unnamed protein product [Symbiodinium sp. CCMP2592]|nr:unnamed protein product [Symbiodinium sp. CCMP2592]